MIAFFAGFWILQADTVRAQDSDSSLVTNQLWTDYYAYWHVKPSVQFYGDAGFRYLIDDGSWWAANIRPSVRLMQGNWVEPRGGLGFFFTYNEAPPRLCRVDRASHIPFLSTHSTCSWRAVNGFCDSVEPRNWRF